MWGRGKGTLILTGIDIHLPHMSNLFSPGNSTKIVDEVKDQQDCFLRKNANTFMRLKIQTSLEWPGKKNVYSIERILRPGKQNVYSIERILLARSQDAFTLGVATVNNPKVISEPNSRQTKSAPFDSVC